MLGLTFKEDVPDLRNSKVVDVVRRLEALGHLVTIHDPLAEDGEARHEYGLTIDVAALDRRYDLVLAAVPHRFYRDFAADRIAGLVNDAGLVADLKGIWRDRMLPGMIDRWTL